ncbi:YchJ family protein [Mycobacterium antarcticum]|uniref:YchJ family protein n=1 Tax=unclassified Mycolicibacterium TaxID=2636767 RepID=UPI0024E10BAB|nr:MULTISPECIES: YchJ family metal-binding protein [unclassified Mycolicibacterium]
MSETFGRPCPCGSGSAYEACCQPLHHGERQADTAETLMRSRYAAYATSDADYLFRTWHPRTRPAHVTVDPDVVWTSLEVTATGGGGVGDETGVVVFTARFEAGGRPEAMHERSRFERRRGRWLYVDGDVG